MDTKEIKQQVQAFESARIRLAKQTHAKEQLECASEVSSEVDLIVVAGPTGVGKSTIVLEYAKEFLASRRAEMIADESLFPLAFAIAVASGDLQVDWTRLYSDILKSLGDPFADVRSLRRDGKRPLMVYKSESPSEGLMREQVESVFQAHGTERCIIDEAQHVIRGRGPGKPGDRLDMLKSQAQTTGAKLILVGTHDLPTYLEHSGQLARRCQVIRLNRYRFSVTAELNEFASAATAMFKKLPSRPKFPDVIANIEFFYVGSIGCTGVLKNWIARAYLRSLRAGRNEVTTADLNDSRLGRRALRTINMEVLACERTQDEDREGPEKDLVEAILMGLNYQPADAQLGVPAKKLIGQAKKKPFERTRVRDTVA